MKWEYKVIDISEDDLEKVLNDLGSEGWELYNMKERTKEIVIDETWRAEPYYDYVKVRFFECVLKRPNGA